ncbi:MAG: hypothetical protein Q4D79_11375 [Propionibacteriaceae bacterium]|nr:hypothetical protein [Propionibacteriaceae bacterium]
MPAVGSEEVVTASGFEQNLSELASSDAEAAENLSRFRDLSPQQQELLERALVDGTALENLGKVLESSEPNLTSEESVEAVQGHKGKDDGAARTTASVDWEGCYVVEQRIYGVLITRLRQDFTWQVTSGRVSATKRCTASAVNYNFVIHLSSDTNHWVLGKRGICETIWHGSAFVKDFTISLDKRQHMEVSASGIYNTWLDNV